MDSSTLKSHSPYKRGADWGAWFGIYLSVLFFVTSYSVSSPVCALIGLLMIIGVPPCIYFMLRKSYVSDNGTTIFSSLWMEGISIFFFGGLIASIVAMIYMRWIDPTFLTAELTLLSTCIHPWICSRRRMPLICLPQPATKSSCLSQLNSLSICCG